MPAARKKAAPRGNRRTTPPRPKVTPTQQVAKDIAMGEHDGGLSDIFAAFLARLKETDQTRKWMLTLDDLEVTQEELTLDECVRLEEETGETWAEMAPPMSSATQAKRILVMFLETRLGLTPLEAAERAGAMTAPEVEQAYSAYVADNPKD